jgi:competence protein ComEC
MLRLLIALLLIALPISGQQLELRFLDVGQGDAVLIREGGKSALVDAGPSADIRRQLEALGVDTIDLLVASHNHADHIGGMTAVLSGAAVRYYMDNAVPHTSATYQRTLQAVVASGAQYLRPTARTITIGSAQLRILQPPPDSRDHNNASIGVLVRYGDFLALLTGDSEWEELKYWLTADSVPRVHVIKVAHHGSRNGTSVEWAEATRPLMAVISVGAGNSYGHPAPGVLAQWQAVGARVHRTDRDGSVVVFANRDASFVVSTARSDTTGFVRVRPFGGSGRVPKRPRTP